jgi:hypothetical protein
VTGISGWTVVANAEGDLEARTLTLAADLNLMRRNLAALGDAIRALDVSLPPGVVLAAANVEQCIAEVETEFGLLTSTQAGVRMGSRSTTPRNAATRAHAHGELLAMRRGRYLLFPGFQFDQHGIRPAISELKSIAARHGWDDVAVIEWMMSPTTYLQGRRPVDVIDNFDLLARTAEAALRIAW